MPDLDMTEHIRRDERRRFAALLLDHLDEISGNRIQWEGHDIWLHTPGQVAEWVRLFALHGTEEEGKGHG